MSTKIVKAIQHAETAEREFLTAVKAFGPDADETSAAFITLAIADAKAALAERETRRDNWTKRRNAALTGGAIHAGEGAA